MSTKDRVANRLLSLPPDKWQAAVDRLVKNMPPSEVISIAEAMEREAGSLAYLAEYLVWRAENNDHPDAAKAAHKQCVKVNRALGYTYPERRSYRL